LARGVQYLVQHGDSEIETSTKLLVLVASLFLSACQAGPGGGAPAGKTETSINVVGVVGAKRTEEWGQGEYQPSTEVQMIVPVEMAGKRVRIILISPLGGDTVLGPIVVLTRGVNKIPIPEGDGVPILEFIPGPTMITAQQFPSPPTPIDGLETAHVYLRLEQLPLQDEGNRLFYLAIRATSGTEARYRLSEMISDFDHLVEGIDPGPLPDYVHGAQVVCWGVDDTSGDFEVTVLRPGTQVDEFALELNGVPEYATLGSGASVWTLGDWQVVDATVLGSDINLPELDAGPVENSWQITCDTDVGDAIEPLGVRYSVEIFSE
jgi:hypothetical protein